MPTQYIPYIKYVISPGTRFERDSRIFFDPNGKVSKGETLRNYGWNQTGFKELIEALYFSYMQTRKGFDEYFEQKIRHYTGNIIDVLRKDVIIKDRLRGLIRLKITDKMAIPILLVEIIGIRYKYCLKPECNRLWKNGKPPMALTEFLEKHNLLNKFSGKYRCSRHLCYELCGSYKQCELMYTSVEDENEIETRILNCLIELIKQTFLKKPASKKFECRPWTLEDHKKKKIGALKDLTKCFERPVRFDLKPLRYYILDPDTWKEIEAKRYNKNPNNQFDAFPVEYLPDIFDNKHVNYTELSAPLRSPGVLECFLQLAAIKFELKYDLLKKCTVCNKLHKITGIPIKAMFRKKADEVYCQETGFAELLWNSLWRRYPREMCRSFDGRSEMSIRESKIIRRELKVKELTNSRYAEASYDFAVNFQGIGGTKKLLVFDLTTGLWKKSGFHETSLPPEEHVNKWKETLCKIPNSLTALTALWYVVINQTEEVFFDETRPYGVENMNELVSLVCDQYPNSYMIIREPKDVNLINIQQHKLLVVSIFNSTPRKGEGRYELYRLFKRDFSKLLVKQVVDFLMRKKK